MEFEMGMAIKKNTPFNKKNIVFHRYKHFNIHLSINPLEYGVLLHYDTKFKVYIIHFRPLTIVKIYI